MHNQALRTEVVIEIPKTHALIEKAVLNELEEQADVTWVKGLGWLKEQTGIKSTTTLRENLLYPYRKELERECVDYPDVRGEHWYFNVSPMKKWLKKNFSKITK